jgi:hypothetical protein
MRRRAALGLCGGILAAALGCAGTTPPAAVPLKEPLPVAALLDAVHDEVTRTVGREEAVVLAGLADSAAGSVLFTPPLVTQTLANPWRGVEILEQRVFRVAVAPLRTHPAAEVITALRDLLGRPGALGELPAAPLSARPEDHVAFLETVLVEADRRRARAIEALGDSERRFLFEHALFLADNFVPQLSEQNEDQRVRAILDNRFFKLTADRIDEMELFAAAQIVASLADEEWLHAARTAFRNLPSRAQALPWVTGDVLLAKETPAGWIVIGGRGANTYRDAGQKVALLLDLGGNDTYAGFAVPIDETQGIGVVIDLEGDDVYEAGSLGLATGRLGVGMLVDGAGNDRYRFDSGSGGAGFAGIGLLVDLNGDDRYEGSRFTQGVAIGGIGLLLDRSGNDDYRSFGYAIGFGGPLGIGAVVDVTGNDAYQCGHHYASGYNRVEAPEAKPGEARYQYDCFGLGAGVGHRILPKQDPPAVEDVAGGIGLVLDQEGNDRYASSNFSQGVGYHFGAGIKMDERGNDVHEAARYGHAAAAHFGVGLFVDRAGADRYASTGPFYNGAAAWDRSVALAVDSGSGDDVYEFQRSTGLGIADRRAWSLFVEAGGRDRYRVPDGLGVAQPGSVSGFFDLGGEDRYETAMAARQGVVLRRDKPGGLFVDR